MVDVKIKQAKNIEPIDIGSVKNIDPVTIATIRQIEKIAPAAVHIKELNHIDPLSIDSLRINEVKNLDPVQVERFNVTHLPTVNLSLSRLPGLDLNVRRVPPVAIGLQQEFYLPSHYTVLAKLLGVAFLRLEIQGRTLLKPVDRFRREQSTTPARSFPDVAAVGNPGIPTKRTEKKAKAVERVVPGPRLPFGHKRMTGPFAPGSMPPAWRSAGPAPAMPARAGLSAGSPHFQYSLSVPQAASGTVGSSVGSGG